MLVAALLLAARLEDGADAAITTVPFLLMGVGMGAMASQLGNVVVSSAPVESGSEVGGLQYTAQNLGSSLGTALVGAIVIGSLGTLVVQGVQSAPGVSEPTRQTVTTSLDSGAQFVSDADVEAALDSAGIAPEEHDELAAVYSSARLDALRNGMVALALFCVAALFFAVGLPERPMTGGP